MQKQTAIITWWTSGIGEEFAYQLAKKWYNIIIVWRNEKKWKQICRNLKKLNTLSQLWLADLSQIEEIKKIEEKIKKEKHISFLINSAGFGFTKKFLDQDINDRTNMLNVHNIATMRLTHTTGKIMKKQKYGNIINVSSLASFLQLGDSWYTSTKARIRIFSTNLFYEWKNYWIYVQALCPWFVKTNFFETAWTKKIPTLWLLDTATVVKKSLYTAKRWKSICIPWFINNILKILMQILPNNIIHKIIS